MSYILALKGRPRQRTISESFGLPRPSSQHKDLFSPEGQRAWNKEQRQETEDEAEGKGNKGDGPGVFVPGDKGLSLHREKTDMALRKQQFIKTQGENLCEDEVFSFNWVC